MLETILQTTFLTRNSSREYHRIVLLSHRISQRSRKIRLSTSSLNGLTRERLEVLGLVAGDDACAPWVDVGLASNENNNFMHIQKNPKP